MKADEDLLAVGSPRLCYADGSLGHVIGLRADCVCCVAYNDGRASMRRSGAPLVESSILSDTFVVFLEDIAKTIAESQIDRIETCYRKDGALTSVKYEISPKGSDA